MSVEHRGEWGSRMGFILAAIGHLNKKYEVIGWFQSLMAFSITTYYILLVGQ